jgi:hypothetical protein
MLNSDEILDSIAATDQERRDFEECARRLEAEYLWQAKKQSDPTVPRQARFQGPKAADLIDQAFDHGDSKRWVAIMEALKARAEEEGYPLSGPE